MVAVRFRAASLTRPISAARSSSDRSWASRTTGTRSPSSVVVAMPRWILWWRMISSRSSSSEALSWGNSFSAWMVARANTAVQVSRTPSASAVGRNSFSSSARSVTSTSSRPLTWGTVRNVSVIRRAIVRRRPRSGIRVESAASGALFPLPAAEASGRAASAGAATGGRTGASAVAVRAAGTPEAACSTSSRTIRPPGPLPDRLARSMPRSRANCRTVGAANGRAPGSGAGAATGPSCSPTAGGATVAAGVAAAGAATAGSTAESDSKVATRPPSLTTPPTGAPWLTRMPVTGAGSSTSALSVSTSRSGWCSLTSSPSSANHEMISASAMPSPRSGRRNSWRVMRPASGGRRRRGGPRRAGSTPRRRRRRGRACQGPSPGPPEPPASRTPPR